jgi:hypothetical protein
VRSSSSAPAIPLGSWHPRRQDELQGHRPARAEGLFRLRQDQDNVVLMPLTTFQRRIAGNRDIDTIYVAGDDAEPRPRLQQRIEDILRETRASRPTARTTSPCAT